MVVVEEEEENLARMGLRNILHLLQTFNFVHHTLKVCLLFTLVSSISFLSNTCRIFLVWSNSIIYSHSLIVLLFFTLITSLPLIDHSLIKGINLSKDKMVVNNERKYVVHFIPVYFFSSLAIV